MVELFDRTPAWCRSQIIGVVQDSRFRSIRDPIDPILFRRLHRARHGLLVRYDGDPATVAARYRAAWQRLARRAL